MIGFWIGLFLAVLVIGVLNWVGSTKLGIGAKKPHAVDPVDTAEGLTRYIELVNLCRTDAHLDKLISFRADGRLPTPKHLYAAGGHIPGPSPVRNRCGCDNPSCALAKQLDRRGGHPDAPQETVDEASHPQCWWCGEWAPEGNGPRTAWAAYHDSPIHRNTMLAAANQWTELTGLRPWCPLCSKSVKDLRRHHEVAHARKAKRKVSPYS